MTIEKEIMDAIKANLPSTVGDVLRERLEQANQDATAIVGAKASIDILNVEVLRLRQQVTAQEVTLAAHGDLAKRHSVTEAAEIRRDVRELTQDLAAEKRITAHALTLLDKLVRNTEYRQSVQSTVPLVMPGTNGCMPTTTTMCGSDTKTSEAA